MDGSVAWQAWRAAVLPVVERILGQSISTTAVRPRLQSSQHRSKARQIRRITSTRIGLAQKPHSIQREYVVHREIQEREDELNRSGIERYPRILESSDKPTLQYYIDEYKSLGSGEKSPTSDHWVAGRVSSIRKAGSKLAFVDIYEEPGHHRLQLMLNLAAMDSVEKKELSDFVKLVSRGDVISAIGTVTRTSTGELSILPKSLPKILSPCLHQMPLTSYQSETASDTDADFPDKHVEMLTNPHTVSTLVTRSRLTRAIRQFLESHNFLEVQTPILAAAAGGATARPFETRATEFSDRKLWLRIAPELWLKRLILGGMSRIYEIGPSFRNEGLDKTHNPEFTTCEFYATYHTLPQLQQLTEDLLRAINRAIKPNNSSEYHPTWTWDLSQPFRQVDFIPTINSALGTDLPNLSSPNARSSILEVFEAKSIPIPSKPTLPRLLDKLCSHYIEVNCDRPTWIINTPECLSPLAKSFIHPDCPNEQPVAARAELFINQHEVVNCYEEENSPFEQRRKFVDQQRYARNLPPLSTSTAGAEEEAGPDSTDPKDIDDEAQNIDHDYLRALEWGLPPTGGWGCGIDRLAMLFTGRERITDVLSFGNLRAVARGAERYGDKTKKTDGEEEEGKL